MENDTDICEMCGCEKWSHKEDCALNICSTIYIPENANNDSSFKGAVRKLLEQNSALKKANKGYLQHIHLLEKEISNLTRLLNPPK